MAFPAGPYTNGQTHTEAGVAFTYNSTIGGWLKASAGSGSMPTATGINSLTGGGDLSADRTISLVNDTGMRTSNWAYMVGPSGAKGFFTAPGTVAFARGILTAPVTVAAGAYYNFSGTVSAMGMNTLVAGKTYIIDVTLMIAGAAPPLVRVMNKTTSTLLSEIRGSGRVFFTPTATTDVGFQNGEAGSATNVTGSFNCYQL